MKSNYQVPCPEVKSERSLPSSMIFQSSSLFHLSPAVRPLGRWVMLRTNQKSPFLWPGSALCSELCPLASHPSFCYNSLLFPKCTELALAFRLERSSIPALPGLLSSLRPDKQVTSFREVFEVPLCACVTFSKVLITNALSEICGFD